MGPEALGFHEAVLDAGVEAEHISPRAIERPDKKHVRFSGDAETVHFDADVNMPKNYVRELTTQARDKALKIKEATEFKVQAKSADVAEPCGREDP